MRLIERASGHTFYDELARRFLDPLRLGMTGPAVRRQLPGEHQKVWGERSVTSALSGAQNVPAPVIFVSMTVARVTITPHFLVLPLDLPVPDHTTLSRRAQRWAPQLSRQRHPEDGSLHVLVDGTGLQVFGAGQGLEDRHGAKSRRSWRKLHLAVDADSGEIIAQCLTGQDDGDASQVASLLDQIDGGIGQFTADGAYDGKPTYRAVLRHSENAKVIIPPRGTAVETGDTGPRPEG
jgi:hypothetical protein